MYETEINKYFTNPKGNLGISPNLLRWESNWQLPAQKADALSIRPLEHHNRYNCKFVFYLMVSIFLEKPLQNAHATHPKYGNICFVIFLQKVTPMFVKCTLR